MPLKRGETVLLAWSTAAALMPKCPLCYLALLGAGGAAGAAAAAFTPAVMIVSLVLSVGAVAMRSRMEGRYGPAVLALAAAIAIVAGRFVFDSTAVVYGGAAALLGAAIYRFAVEGIRWHKPLEF